MKQPLVSKSELETLIENKEFRCNFQPIFDVRQSKAVGYEALIRCLETSPFNSPIELFDSAFEYGLLVELELCCRRIAIQKFTDLGLNGYLFLNVSPLAIEQTKHKPSAIPEILLEYGLAPERIVIEITERYEAQDHSLLKMGLKRYRDLGFKIAIDDLGTGYSGLKQWAEVRPDIVKIDRYFISECQHNIVKRELIRTIFELGKATDVSIITEGIETDEEYIFLRKLGMTYAQGYLLGRPVEHPNGVLPEELQILKLDGEAKENILQSELSEIIIDTPPLHANMACKEVHRLFKDRTNIHSFAIIDEKFSPIGMVYRDELSELLSSDYGHALYDKSPVSKVMKPVNLMVECTTSIDEASHFITDNSEFDHHSEFVVTQDGKYAGLVNVRSILKRMTEEKIKHAQQANPLTMLPGNIVIDQKVNQLIHQKQAFQLAYFDLDNFKPFNDIYGYAAGDQVIKLVADIVSENCGSNFVGHVGGDDFVVIFSGEDALPFCKQILDVFEKRIQNYFEPEHIASNGYTATDRNGELKFFPLLGLSCGVIFPEVDQINTVHDVAILASEAKKKAKKAGRGEVFALMECA